MKKVIIMTLLCFLVFFTGCEEEVADMPKILSQLKWEVTEAELNAMFNIPGYKYQEHKYKLGEYGNNNVKYIWITPCPIECFRKLSQKSYLSIYLLNSNEIVSVEVSLDTNDNYKSSQKIIFNKIVNMISKIYGEGTPLNKFGSSDKRQVGKEWKLKNASIIAILANTVYAEDDYVNYWNVKLIVSQDKYYDLMR